MKNIKINSFTLFFLCIAFFSGYIKIALWILFIVLVHESGHIFFAKVLGYQFISVTIYPFGGVTRINKDINAPFWHEFLLAIGGVLFQSFIFLLLFFPFRSVTKDIIFTYNSAILLFNLLPIIPLDGSLLFSSFLNKYFSYKTAYYIYVIVSFVAIVFYIGMNYWMSLNNYFIVSLFLMKTINAIKEYKYYYNRFLLERYLYNYPYKRIDTKKGNLDVLRKETYQYFIEGKHIVSEKKKLADRFDKKV